MPARGTLRVLAAPDKFRGSATAVQVAAAIATGVRRAGGHCRELPLADGGEGTLDALGGANRTSSVTGPDGAPVAAGWRLHGEIAVVEMARASGLEIVGGPERNHAVRATSRGAGELIRDAILAGSRRLIVAVGGSASTDGGLGALEALGGLVPFPSTVQVTVACDVTTRFVDAARVFAPQKGASPSDVEFLTRRLESLRATYCRRFGVDVEAIAGSGAAGGLAGALAAAGGTITAGFDMVAHHVKLADALGSADLVVTGEGCLDGLSLAGKVVGRVLDLATAASLPVVAVVGRCDLDPLPNGLTVTSLAERFGDRSWSDTATCVADAVAAALTNRQTDRSDGDR